MAIKTFPSVVDGEVNHGLVGISVTSVAFPITLKIRTSFLIIYGLLTNLGI